MKLYHISDTNGFFHTLSKCSGTVNLVTSGGKELSLTDNDREGTLNLIASTFSGSVIREIELHFTQPKDAERILTYCAGMKTVA